MITLTSSFKLRNASRISYDAADGGFGTSEREGTHS